MGEWSRENVIPLWFVMDAVISYCSGRNREQTAHWEEQKKREGQEKQRLPRQAKAVIERLSQYECERGFVSEKNTASYI